MTTLAIVTFITTPHYPAYCLTTGSQELDGEAEHIAFYCRSLVKHGAGYEMQNFEALYDRVIAALKACVRTKPFVVRNHFHITSDEVSSEVLPHEHLFRATGKQDATPLPRRTFPPSSAPGTGSGDQTAILSHGYSLDNLHFARLTPVYSEHR